MTTPAVLLLVVDADEALAAWVAGWLKGEGHEVRVHDHAEAGLADALASHPALVIGELTEPLDDGRIPLQVLADALPDTAAIVITDHAEVDEVVGALHAGASDFINKFLLNDDILRLSVQRALERRALRLDNEQVRRQLEQTNQRLQHSLQVLEQDQRAGRQVQAKLLPPTPHSSNGITLCHHILPSLFLSGDFVDYFSLGAGRIGFYLADVSGHGASSAFVTVFLKTLTNRIRRHFEKRTAVSTLSPGRLMAAMNEELRALETGKHLTMFCGVIDTNQQVLLYAHAAHYPPALLCQNGGVQLLPGQGLPLGLFPDARYEEFSVPLAARFSLALCSDGILEILPAGSLPEKEARLQAEVAAADGQLDTLITSLGLHQVRDVPDDIALLMIKRDG